ncbi:vomeronasal type-2 receptor 1-like [Gastrophryne carolinensis]
MDRVYQKVTFNTRPRKTLCTTFSSVFFQSLQALIFAVEEVNRNADILPNITLGFQMYDTCNDPHYELQGALHFLTRATTANLHNQCNSSQSFPAVIGSSISANSIILAHVLGIFRYPQISGLSSVSILSNRKLFPSFFRTIPNDKVQSTKIAQLVLHFGWTWVGLVAMDNDYGLLGIQPIMDGIVKAGACIAFLEYIRLGQPDYNAPNIVKTIKNSKATVIVVFSGDNSFAPVVKEMIQQNVTGKTFIGNGGWSRSVLLSLSSYFPVLSGALGFAAFTVAIPGLNEFIQKIHPSLSAQKDWVTMYWERMFNCKYLNDSNLTGLGSLARQCTGTENLEDIKKSSSFLSSLQFAHTLYGAISGLSSVSILSNRKLFPSFFRTIPNDKVQSTKIAQLVLHFGWTWVGLVAMDNDYGLLGIQPIMDGIVKAGACIAFLEYIRLGQPDYNAPNIVKTIKNSKATVIVVFSGDNSFAPVVKEMIQQNVTGKTFIGNGGWSRSVLLSLSSYFPVLSGALGFAAFTVAIPGLNEFIQKIHPSLSAQKDWVTMYWERMFNCKYLNDSNLTGLGSLARQCTGTENLEDIKKSSSFLSSLQFAHTLYGAVYVLAKALDNLTRCKLGKGPFYGGSCATIWTFNPWQLTYYVKRVRMILSYGEEIYFDENGGAPSIYSIVNWQMDPEGTVNQVDVGSGTYSTSIPSDKALFINSSLVLWPMASHQVPRSVCSVSCPTGFRKASIRGQPSCCFECVPCLQGEISNQSDASKCFRCPWNQWPNDEKSSCVPKPMEYLIYEDMLGSTLAFASVMSALVPVSIFWLFNHHKNTPMVKASNYSLSCLLLASLCLCFLCSLGFIGHPHAEKCLLRQVSFGLVFTLCVSCVLAKTIMVVFAFMASRPGSSLKKWTRLRVSYTIIVICFLVEFFVVVLWLILAPPLLQYNIEAKPGIIIVECNEGSPTAFWTMLGYLFLLATISFIVAFLARRLPDSFNEAKFITFSMLAFLSVWISYIPASLSAQGKYTVAMEIFAILASSWALVICMFLPKCFIILFRPDMNTKEYLMRRERQPAN